MHRKDIGNFQNFGIIGPNNFFRRILHFICFIFAVKSVLDIVKWFDTINVLANLT